MSALDCQTRADLLEIIDDSARSRATLMSSLGSPRPYGEAPRYSPMATSNSPTYGQSNSSMQDEGIMRHRR
jgi:hypothetical protein